MTFLHVLDLITWAISIGALIYFLILAVPLIKAFWVTSKAEAEEEIRLKKAAEALQEVADERDAA